MQKKVSIELLELINKGQLIDIIITLPDSALGDKLPVRILPTIKVEIFCKPGNNLQFVVWRSGGEVFREVFPKFKAERDTNNHSESHN